MPVLSLWIFMSCSLVNEAKWSEMRWSEVQYRGGGEEWVFMEKVYRSSKWWEVKDWGESMSDLMIVKKNNYKKLYTVLPSLGVLSFVHVVF